MAVILDEIPEFTGPLEGFPSPFPAPVLATAIHLSAYDRFMTFWSSVTPILSSLNTIRNNESQVRNSFEYGRIELEQARIELEQINLVVELQDLLMAEANFGVADAEFDKLQTLDPGNISISPITVTFPDIDYAEEWYLNLRFIWDTAWPLWPYAPPL